MWPICKAFVSLCEMGDLHLRQSELTLGCPTASLYNEVDHLAWYIEPLTAPITSQAWQPCKFPPVTRRSFLLGTKPTCWVLACWERWRGGGVGGRKDKTSTLGLFGHSRLFEQPLCLDRQQELARITQLPTSHQRASGRTLQALKLNWPVPPLSSS